MNENAIEQKSFDFAVEIVKLCRKLTDERHEYVLSKQLLRSGTSIGANITEAQRAQSTADFISKMSISLKEADESKYWLRLLRATDYLEDAEYAAMMEMIEELIRILFSIIRTTKKNQL